MANAPLDCDLLVVGSGAAGLAAAVSAAYLGKRVILVEKDAVLGGATAWSGGWLWAPRNPLARRAGIIEDIGPTLDALGCYARRDAAIIASAVITRNRRAEQTEGSNNEPTSGS